VSTSLHNFLRGDENKMLQKEWLTMTKNGGASKRGGELLGRSVDERYLPSLNLPAFRWV
jgi:hypothetical protein